MADHSRKPKQFTLDALFNNKSQFFFILHNQQTKSQIGDNIPDWTLPIGEWKLEIGDWRMGIS